MICKISKSIKKLFKFQKNFLKFKQLLKLLLRIIHYFRKI